MDVRAPVLPALDSKELLQGLAEHRGVSSQAHCGPNFRASSRRGRTPGWSAEPHLQLGLQSSSTSVVKNHSFREPHHQDPVQLNQSFMTSIQRQAGKIRKDKPRCSVKLLPAPRCPQAMTSIKRRFVCFHQCSGSMCKECLPGQT